MTKYIRAYEAAFMIKELKLKQTSLDLKSNDNLEDKQGDDEGLKIMKVRAHEEAVEALYKDLLQKIGWLQHERLVHLLVLILSAIWLLGVFVLVMTVATLGLWILLAILLTLCGFYCYHYYFLENTVQRWYHLADELRRFLV